MQRAKAYLLSAPESCYPDVGLLLMRVAFGALMLFGHGLGKLMQYSEKSAVFPDPLGVGSPLSLALAIFAEVVCSLAVVLGLFTRAALVPLMVTMLVAVFIIHADDPWQKKEFALLYLIPYFVLFLTGPGKYSLDIRGS